MTKLVLICNFEDVEETLPFSAPSLEAAREELMDSWIDFCFDKNDGLVSFYNLELDFTEHFSEPVIHHLLEWHSLYS